MTAANNDASPMDGAPVIDFDKFKPTRSFTSARKRKDFAMKALISCAFIVALIPLFSVLLTTIINGVKRLNLNFLSYNMTGVVGGNPTPSGGYGGILHAIIGTLEITFGAMLISIPIGLMCAVYLVEYSNRGKLAQVITLLVDVMSGIPSIVAGLFAFSMFTILIGPGTINGFEGSVALSLLMLRPWSSRPRKCSRSCRTICARPRTPWASRSSARSRRSCCAPPCRASFRVRFSPSPA